MVVNKPIFALLSIESDVPRPRVLKRGSLAACFDELREAGLHDAVACNRARLEIVATDGTPDERRPTRTLFTIYSNGEGV